MSGLLQNYFVGIFPDTLRTDNLTFLAYDQNWQSCERKNFCRIRPKYKVAQRSVAVRAHDNQIDRVFFCILLNFLRDRPDRIRRMKSNIFFAQNFFRWS